MAKFILLVSLACLFIEVKLQSVQFGETNIIWTLYSGRKEVAAFLPGDPFRGPRRYGTIPWTFNAKIPYGISYHYMKEILVFSDLNRRGIYFIDTSLETFNSTQFHAGFGWVEHTAVDWISDNLYWVDGYYEWIAMKSMNSNDLHEYKIIADADVISPRGIAVDPNNGYIFWTDISGPPRIVRAEMDGTRQTVIAAQGLINPFDITLHPDNGRIWWVDRSRDTLETVMNDGTGREVVFTSHQGQPVGLSYYRDHVFFADTNFDDVVVLDMANGLGKTFFKLNQRKLGIARVLTIWAKENQPDKYKRRGMCANKRCAQDCVLDRTGNPKCLCRENSRLDSDGTSCVKLIDIPHHALLLTNGSDICAYHLTAPQGTGVPDTVNCFKEGKSSDDIGSLAVDSNNMKLYYSSKSQQQIRVLNLVDKTSATFVDAVKDVGGMSFDYITGELYWSDTVANKIRKKKQGSRITTVRENESGGFGDVAVDPYHRLMFYIVMASKPYVVRYDLDHSNSTVLAKVKTDKPQRLAYDDKKQRVIWTDAGKIVSVTYKGRAEPAVGTLNIRNRALVSYGKFLMWSTAQKNGTSLIHMYKPPDKSTYRRLPTYFPGTITDFAIYDKLRHSPDRDECFTKNGGCDHICLPGQQTNKCVCNIGYNLDRSGKKCISNLVYDNFTFATDLMSKRVVQVNLNNGNIAGTKIGENTLVSNVVVMGKTAYWADQSKRVIKKSDLDGTNAMAIHNTANLIVQRIAVDPGTQNIYYTASNGVTGLIGVINKNGTRKKTLISDVKFVKDIKIHAGLGLMFWIERRVNPGIERATMHGENRVLVVRSAPNSLIFGIDIDYEENMLYWCDKKEGIIRRSDFYGDLVEDIFQDKESSITDIAIFGKYIYYVGTSSNGVLRINKKDGTNGYQVVETHLLAQLHDISLFSKSTTIPTNAKCAKDNAGCSSFCLPTNDFRDYVCECAEGDTLLENLKQCSGDLHPDIPLLPGKGTPPQPSQPGQPTIPTKSIPPEDQPKTTVPSDGKTAKISNTETATGGVNPAAIAVPIVIIVLIAIAAILVFVVYRRRVNKRSPLVSDPRGSENPSYFNGSSSVETAKT